MDINDLKCIGNVEIIYPGKNKKFVMKDWREKDYLFNLLSENDYVILDTNVADEEIYEYIDGEIETLETDFETEHFARAGGGGKIRGDKLSKTFVFEIIITTDKGIRYEIGGKGDIINTIEPKDQGLQVLRVYKQNEDGTWNYSKGYLQIGSELN